MSNAGRFTTSYTYTYNTLCMYLLPQQCFASLRYHKQNVKWNAYNYRINEEMYQDCKKRSTKRGWNYADIYLLTDIESSLVQWHSLIVLLQVMIQSCQIVQWLSNIRMIRDQQLLPHLKRPFQEQLGSAVLHKWIAWYAATRQLCSTILINRVF